VSDLLAAEKAKYDQIWRKSRGAYSASCPEVIFLSTRLPNEHLVVGDWLIVGSGDGTGYRWLQNKQKRKLWACDLSSVVGSFYPRNYFVACPAHAIPHPTNRFDAVLCIDVIEHIPPDLVRPSIAEMMRVLRPGGSLFIQARCAPSVFAPGLHLTVENHIWWRGVFSEVGKIQWGLRTSLDEAAQIRKDNVA